VATRRRRKLPLSMTQPTLLARIRRRLLGALALFLTQPLRHAERPAPGDAQSLHAVLRPGDVLLSDADSRMAALVRRITRSSWSHVSMYVGPLEDGPDPRCVVEADLAAGVRAVPLSSFAGQRARVLRPMGLGEAERRRIADWVVNRIGDPYDVAHAWTLARWLLRLPARPATIAQDAKRFICSSLLAQAFLFIGFPIAAAAPGYVIPRDFESASGFEVVRTLPG